MLFLRRVQRKSYNIIYYLLTQQLVEGQDSPIDSQIHAYLSLDRGTRVLSTTRPPSVVSFLDWNYYYRSVATQIPFFFGTNSICRSKIPFSPGIEPVLNHIVGVQLSNLKSRYQEKEYMVRFSQIIGRSWL